MKRARAHDPERDAAAYIGAEMSPRQRRRFEAHLIGCEACWREVRLDQEGRRRAEGLRELPPPSLRDDVRAAVLFAPVSARPRSRRTLMAVAAAFAMLATVAIAVDILGRGTNGEPPSVAAAVASYRAQTIPAGAPHRSAPDLLRAGLELTDVGRGALANVTADVFAYRDPSGGLVYLFMSPSTFPAAAEAIQGSGMVGGWTASADGLLMICRSRPSSYLLIGSDSASVLRADQLMSSGGAEPPPPT